MAPTHHLFDSHKHCNPEWCPAKANKNVSTGKYRNIEYNKEMFDWLIQSFGKRMEGEKLKALHHPFDTQMNEAMNNAVARRCPKNKMFAGSQSLVYRVASVAVQQTKGANKYMSDVYERLGMTMSTRPTTNLLESTAEKAKK